MTTPAVQSPPWCRHRADYPENVIWPDHVALQHFDLCLTQEQRKAHFSRMREAAERGSLCWQMNDVGRIVHLTDELIRAHRQLRFRIKRGPAYRRRQLARRRRRR